MTTQDLQTMILALMKQEDYQPLTVSEFEDKLEMIEASEFKALVKTLVKMEAMGKIARAADNTYGLPEQMNQMRGRFIGHAKGFGFVVPEQEGMNDVFIPPTEINGAINGDTVLIKLARQSSGDRQEGTILKVIERKQTSFVGTFQDNRGYGFVILDDKKLPFDIFVAKGDTLGAMDGHKVVVEVKEWATGERSVSGYITKILGHKNDPGVDILSIIYKYGITIDFPQEVMNEANAILDTVQPNEYEGRRDLRDQTIVTIDGADAKDLDDAVTVTKNEDGTYKLGVYIADVSYYVREGTALNEEAYDRATSVYLTDRVIPMLPHRLSNGICSLNPNVDRLTMSCEMVIDGNGKVVSHEIFEGVINTTERMTYTDVYKILEEKDEELLTRYAPLVPMFTHMAELAQILRNKRADRGAIDFDFKESQVLVDADGWPTDIVIRERTVAERLIEEFMLAANETVAEHFHWMNVPFLYRIHEDPKPEKLQRFFEFVTNFGLIIKGTGSSVHPKAMQKIIKEIEGLPEEPVISTMMLRSMQQAKYNPESLGHFGLSTDFYTHFTSPIRRYPDLIVHRLIRTYLIKGDTSRETIKKWSEMMDEIADHTSGRERRAVEAERDTDSLKKAQFMVDKVGEEYTGIISSITNFGMFIELPNTIEGLVHISNMHDDYYNFNDRQMIMIGERTNRQFRIGDEVKIVVTNVNIEESAIDFEIVTDGVAPTFKRTRKVAPRVIQAERGKRRTGGSDRKRSNRRRSEDKPKRRTDDKPAKRSKSRRSTDDKPRAKQERDPRGKRVGDKDKPKFYEAIAKKNKRSRRRK